MTPRDVGSVRLKALQWMAVSEKNREIDALKSSDKGRHGHCSTDRRNGCGNCDEKLYCFNRGPLCGAFGLENFIVDAKK